MAVKWWSAALDTHWD